MRVSGARSARRMGGGPAPPSSHGPYPAGYPMGRETPGPRESWERIWYAGMGVATVLVVVGLWTRPNDKPSAWARRELEDRQAKRAQ